MLILLKGGSTNRVLYTVVGILQVLITAANKIIQVYNLEISIALARCVGRGPPQQLTLNKPNRLRLKIIIIICKEGY
jgi:hypothetical protein